MNSPVITESLQALPYEWCLAHQSFRRVENQHCHCWHWSVAMSACVFVQALMNVDADTVEIVS